MAKTWFITGASRGLGLELARSALRNGDRVVAAARNPTSIAEALGPDSDTLLAVTLDVTDIAQVQPAIDAALGRFGAIDVLVNNAGYGHLGFFEETSAADVKAQFATNLFGAFDVTRAALPSMRAARKGLIYNVSSTGGLSGNELASLYCASKFALEGFSESLAKEVAPFGISITIVEPGPFRTDFLTPESIRFEGVPIADYAERRALLESSFKQRDGSQPGDPVRLADALVRLADEKTPPMRFLAGAVAQETAAAKLASLHGDFDTWRAVSLATDYPA
jgi:NAD(P)-dependent dehydrogenase (short-subunit alcohol dehydrogenase family)